MRRHRPALPVLLAFLLFGLARGLTSQSAQLRVISASPQGETNQLQDANEIRIIFSEPMVALGRIPSNPTPAWIRITPAIAGAFRWLGTTVLIFSPDPATPLPYSTRYTLTIDASATSVAGRALGASSSFTFTTPTVKLTSMQWQRRNGRFDQPVQLALRFNQPVRPADIAAHATVRYGPQEFEAPELPANARARMAALDAEGLRRFDAKVAAARATAARRDAVPVRVATSWDEKRFPPGDNLVVLDTTTAPAVGTSLRLTLDARVPGAQGSAVPPQPQSSVAQLTRVFFALDFGCTVECNPSGYNSLRFSTSVPTAKFADALSVRDITVPARERLIAKTSTVARTPLDEEWAPGLEDAGYARQPPATTFAYRLDPGMPSMDGQTLGYPWIGIVQNWHETAFTSFGDGHGVWESDGGPQLPFYSRNFRDLQQWVARIAPADLVPRIVALEKDDFKPLPPGAGTARRLTVTPDATQSYGLDLRPVLSATGTGLVWAGLRPGEPIAQSKRAVRAEDADHSTIVQVTNLGITVKDSPQQTLIFVTRLDTGAAVPDATVSVINLENKVLWRGPTGRDGVAMAPAMPLRTPDNWYDLSFVVTAEKNGDIAYVGSNWNEGILPWDFDNNFDLWEATEILRGSVFSDRGVYKPGEEVHLKTIVRADTPNGIRLLPAGSTLDVTVRDSRNREVDTRKVTLTRWSTAEWTWTVPAEGTLGNYAIEATLPGTQPAGTGDESRRTRADWLHRVGGSFLVAAYRRPDFRVDTTIAADSPVAGAALRAGLDARYLFGSAMSRRPVKWSITRSPDQSIPSAIHEKFPEERFAFGYYPDVDNRTERVVGETATLDAAGKFTTTLTSATDVDYARRYTFEGDVEDASRQHIANRSSLVVHPAPWYIGLRRPDYFADTATGTSVDVVAVNLQGAPVASVPVTITLTRIQWNSVRRAEGGGFYTWDSEEVRVPAGEWTVTSANTPVRLPIPVSEGGAYEIAATASDGSGHRTRTETSFYALGKGYTAWQRFDHNRITLEPEKKTWKPGETARLMVQSPWETATALVTVEREGVKRYQRFDLTSTQQTVEVPVSEADIPNVYVSVLLVRGRTSKDPGADGNDPGKPSFRLGYAELRVEDVTKHLGVKVSADRAEYRPANTAKVSVAVEDSAGRPASSEVTLWAVDYGVLSLTNYQAPNLIRAIYQDKALQVLNEDSRQRIVSRRVLTPKGDGEGGGGGDDAGAGAFRRDFRPLAFWLGSVETDATGRATRDVTLPEALTTYRIMAVAGDTASRFGAGDAEIKVNKPVTLLAAFPRFMSLGDQASFGAVVTNTLATGGGAVVTIRSLDPALLQFQGAASQTIQLGAGATEPVRFDATARGIGNARVQMTITLGAETDAFETTLPVSAPAPVETTAAFGDTDSRTVETLTVPAGTLPSLGGLSVDLSSTALVGLGEGARYLLDYPYACAEQKASAALAMSLSADLGNAFSMSGVPATEYRTRAAALLRDLPRYQCPSGSFAYWPGACTIGNVYLTSYVLHVMKVADGLGLPSDASVIKSALDFLEEEVKKDLPPDQVQWQPVWSASNAFSVRVLAEYGRNQDSNITRLLQFADRMPIFAMSYLADAMAAGNARGQRYDDLVRRMTNAMRIEGDRAHVEELDQDALAWLWNSNVRATALVLDGFVRRGDDPTVVQRMVRWLLAARRNGRWDNTQDNATALEALVDYYKKFEADIPDMAATVAIAGQPVGTATFRGRSTVAQSVRLAMPDLLRQVPAGSERELAMSRTGTGRLYYAARLQVAPTTPLAMVQQGIRIERRYARYAESGDGPAATTFAAGDLIRVTLSMDLPQERRYVAVTDMLPAGVEAVDSWFRTTASDVANEASAQRAEGPGSQYWWARGGFDHVEKRDDRVQLFATRLAVGHHEFSYLVRATTTGTFTAAGTVAEEMYAPEVKGRSAPTSVVIR